MSYQFLVINPRTREPGYEYLHELNLKEEEVIDITAQIEAELPVIRFDSRRIYPVRLHYRIFLRDSDFPYSSQELHDRHPEGYKGNFDGKEVSREILSKESFKILKKRYELSKEKIATAFLSASFSEEVDCLISQFIKIAEALNIDVIWLKEKYQARPPEEKIKENILLCNCFIQILTRNVFEERKEAGWLGNEIAWARDSTPNGNMAIFVQKGEKATGLAGEVADRLEFDPDNLKKDAPKIVQYLTDLRNRV